MVTVLLCGLLGLLTACRTESEREHEREAGRVTQTRTAAEDGLIHLTKEQVKANGLQTETVIARELAPSITALGRVTARAGGEAQVFSPFAGRLIADPARLPHIGNVVRKDQVLAEVEQLVTASEQVQFAATAAQLQSALDQAKQEVQLRRTELERSKQLYDGGAIPLKQLQSAEFELAQAQTRLEGATRARQQYEAILSQPADDPRRAPIRAPILGTVVAADLTAGQLVDPAKSLLTIVDLSSVWIEVSVHETDLPLVQHTQQMEFTTPANPGRTCHGRLVTVGNLVDSVNRTVKVIFTAPNPDDSLRIGMTAEARIPTRNSQQALLIPTSAILAMDGQPSVYVEKAPGVYERRLISTGERRDDKSVVQSGLRLGEKIVSVGAGSLRSETFKGQIPVEAEGEKP